MKCFALFSNSLLSLGLNPSSVDCLTKNPVVSLTSPSYKPWQTQCYQTEPPDPTISSASAFCATTPAFVSECFRGCHPNKYLSSLAAPKKSYHHSNESITLRTTSLPAQSTSMPHPKTNIQPPFSTLELHHPRKGTLF